MSNLLKKISLNQGVYFALFLATPLWAQRTTANLTPGTDFDSQSQHCIPQVVDGGGYRTTIYITNTSTTKQESVLILFLGDDGNLIDVSIQGFGRPAAIFPTEIAPGQTRSYRTSGDGAQTQQGYAMFSTPTARNLTMYASIEAKDSTTGQWASHATISSTVSILGAGFMAFDNTQNATTAIALVNTEKNSNSVGYTIRDAEGGVVEQGTLPLDAAHHTAFLISQKWPATAGKTGTIMFGTPNTEAVQGKPTRVAILGLLYRMTATGLSFTQIPISEQGSGRTF